MKNTVPMLTKTIELNGKAALAKLLFVEGQEGMLSTHLAELLNIANSTMREHIQRYAISAQALPAHSMRSLKDMDVIPIHARTAVFLPRDSVRALVKIINTDEAWLIYRQLWDDAEELNRIKPEYLSQRERLIELQRDLNILKDERDDAVSLASRTQEQNEQLAHDLISVRALADELSAKLQAANHHIVLGGNRKSPKFSIPIYRREPNDIFDNPVYSIEIVKKARDEMNPDEQHRFQSYHSTRTIVGLSRGLEKTFDKLGVTNDYARSILITVKESAMALKEQLEPNAKGLFVLNRLESQAYLN
jgi:hypothetical protein